MSNGNAPAKTIPGPKPVPFVGNILEMLLSDDANSIEFARRYYTEYGGIVALQIGGSRQILVSQRDLVAEMCSSPMWSKSVHEALETLRDLGGDGLFTAYNEEPNWGKAHRLLMPAFGTMAMRDYFPQMLDIAEQMMTRWERFGPDSEFNVAEQMTRLTLDTIALCAFNVRFNSFYTDDAHPFVTAMTGALSEAENRSTRLPGVQPFLIGTNRQYRADIATMHRIADDIVSDRIATPAGERPDDLLERMLTASDPLTGEKLSAENVRFQMATFLIAGHETTSGLLSFATYLLLTDPAVYQRAQRTVDTVLGDRTPTFEDLKDLGYVGQVLRETLRLYPTAPGFSLTPDSDTMLGGYAIAAGEEVSVLLPMLHRDPAVWENPDTFDPDRFAPDRLSSIPEFAWMPFGHGARACIGRPFALQEATLVLAMMLQRFEITLTDPSHSMTIHETLTLKPANLAVRARARAPLAAVRIPAAPAGPADTTVSRDRAHNTPMLVLYGSNGGSSESLARTIAGDGDRRGWDTRVAPMDEYVGKLPTAGPVIFVTSSYNGTPPDNARGFMDWVTEAGPDLHGVDFLVLGCGSMDWAATYQRVPTLLDAALKSNGANRVRDRGEIDALNDFHGDWERWYQPLWNELAREYRLELVETNAPRYRIADVHASASDRTALTARVLENRELVRGGSGRSKRHLELRLPAGVTYRTGDYLSVHPENDPALVERMMTRLGLDPARAVTVTSESPAGPVPLGVPILVTDLLTRHVDLSVPATAGVVARLAQATKCPPERIELEGLAGERYAEQVMSKRFTLLDLLEMFASCEVDLAWILDALPAPRARQYSISSATEAQSDIALTVSVVECPALSGRGTYRGTASGYLQRARPGDRIGVTLSAPADSFRPPANNNTPIIMIAAGSGIAPFRGFIQARLARMEKGAALGDMHLFFGCQHPDWDDLYADEFNPSVDAGHLTVHRAYSQLDSEITYVQHQLRQQRATVLDLADRGAHIYVCGDVNRMGPGVEQTLTEIGMQRHGSDWLDELSAAGRYSTDLF